MDSSNFLCNKNPYFSLQTPSQVPMFDPFFGINDPSVQITSKWPKRKKDKKSKSKGKERKKVHMELKQLRKLEEKANRQEMNALKQNSLKG